MLLPLKAGPVPEITLLVDAAASTCLQAQLWRASRQGNTTPDVKVAETAVAIPQGNSIQMALRFDVSLEADSHVFVILEPNPTVTLHLSKEQMPGVLTLWQRMNRMVAKSVVQSPPEGSGVDTFAFWLPDRRPAARNLAFTVSPAVRCYEPTTVINGWSRPWCGANAWAPARNDDHPWLRLAWDRSQTLHTIEITFDADFDHPMESVLMGHPERVMPGCVRSFDVRTSEGITLAAVVENHQTRWRLNLREPVTTKAIELHILDHGPAPPAIFEVRCY